MRRVHLKGPKGKFISGHSFDMEAVAVPIYEALKAAQLKRKSRKAHVGKKINNICWNDRVSLRIWAERGTSEKGNPALVQAIEAI